MIPARFLPQKKYVLITAVSVIVLLVLYTGTFFIFFRLDERIIVSRVTAYREETREFGTVFFCSHESRIVEYDAREWVYEKARDGGERFMSCFIWINAVYQPLHALIARFDFRQRDVLERDVEVAETYMIGWEKGMRIPLEHFEGIVHALLTREINDGIYEIR